MRLASAAIAGLTLAVCSLSGQTAPARSAYAISWDEVLHRASNGHSPTADEITAAGSPASQPAPADVAQAVPSIRKALLDPDTMVRQYALTALTGLEIPPAVPEPPVAPPNPAPPPPKTESSPQPMPLPAIYKPEIATALVPAIPEIGKDLADESSTTRVLAATVLAGFAPSPPASIYPPLLAYLKRDDGTGPSGIAVVDDLLQLGPISNEVASALIRYLRRSDQTADDRASLIDSIAGHPNQNQSLNKALLTYLNSDDPAVRARLILSLPQLDLAPDVLADTQARISILASNDQENPQVLRAAKAVTSCWTSTRMASGCPVY